MNKLIIEVRMNELAKRAGNPNIPYRPDEIVADALACADAGAAVVHFHGRTASGEETSDPDFYREAVSGLRAKSDILIHTTLGQFDSTEPEKRTDHIRQLAKEGLQPDIAPLDMGSNNVDFFDAETKTFTGWGFVYQNSTADLRSNAERLKSWGIKPQLAIWTVPSGRLMHAFLDAGLLDGPAFAVFLLSDAHALAGHPATLAGLRAFVDLCADERVMWSVLCYGTSMLPLVPEILKMGGHISIGLGDHDYAELGLPTNADLVREVVSIARSLGREVATPGEARTMLGA